jgi:hypothetical protein
LDREFNKTQNLFFESAAEPHFQEKPGFNESVILCPRGLLAQGKVS